MTNKGSTVPDKRTEDIESIVLEALRKSMPLELAAHAAMITPQSVYNWIREDDTFRRRCEEAKQVATMRLVGLTEAKDPWKILKNQAPKHFKDVVENKVTLNYTEEIEDDSGEIEKV